MSTEKRLSKLLDALKEADLDAVMLTGRADLYYCFGIEVDAGDAVGIVSQKGSWYFTDGRYIEEARCAVRDVEVIDLPAGSSYLRHVGKYLYRNHLVRIGYESDMPACDLAACGRYISGELVPVSGILNALRSRKDEDELTALAEAQRIADRAFEELLNDIRPGVTERFLAARLQYLMMLEGADGPAFPTLVQSGENGAMPHSLPSDRRLKRGEFITVDFGCRKGHYCSDTTRTLALVSTTDAMTALYSAVRDAQAEGIAAAMPGNSRELPDSLSRQSLKTCGYDSSYCHAFGHGIGIEPHEEPVMGPGYAGKLASGMVVSAEPGVYLPGEMGVRIEDTYVIGDNGPRRLSRLSQELLVL